MLTSNPISEIATTRVVEQKTELEPSVRYSCHKSIADADSAVACQALPISVSATVSLTPRDNRWGGDVTWSLATSAVINPRPRYTVIMNAANFDRSEL